jgi:Leucine-rich repeat (LRR) protein
MYMSNNLIQSLNGIEHYPNLHVLSISFNDIKTISELRYLMGIPLHTLNLEGNPLTRLPYYADYAISLIPTLRRHDSRPVNKSSKTRADSSVKLDRERLTDLCINEIRISSLRSLLDDHESEDSEWFAAVQSILGPLTFESLGMDEDQIHASFDRMREVVRDCREKQKRGQSTEWAEIYKRIESLQQKALDEVTLKVQFRMKAIREVSRSPSPARPIRKSPSPRIVKTLTPKKRDNSTILLRLHQHSLIRSVLKAWKEIVVSSPVIDQAGTILERGKMKILTRRCFGIWKCTFFHRCRSLDPEKGALLEKVQDTITKIADLEAQLELQAKANRELRAAITQQQKTAQAVKNVIRKREEDRKILESSAKDAEAKCEDDVLQLMLETKFKQETDDRRIDELEARVRRSEQERDRLNIYIRRVQEAHQEEITELQGKLQSAFQVSSEFRKEISILKNQMESPPTRGTCGRQNSSGSSCGRVDM